MGSVLLCIDRAICTDGVILSYHMRVEDMLYFSLLQVLLSVLLLLK